MAAAAAAAAWVHERGNTGTDSFAAVAAVVVAVHEVIPDKAPAFAAQAAKGAGATNALCTAIAAGVAAAAVGWEFEVVKKVSSAASKAFSDYKTKAPADIAKHVAEEVRKVSSRYPAVEAAAAAAYAAYVPMHAFTSGSGAPVDGAIGGDIGGATGGAAGAPAYRVVEDGAAIAAANAAGEAAKANGDPDPLAYAATAAARAATFRGASSQSVFTAAVKAATPTNATPANAASANDPGPEDLQELAEHVAVAITAASYADKLASPVLAACSHEMLEMIPNSHQLIYGKLGTIVALDTFLAAFLLFSLTGRKQADDAIDTGEVVQTILQAYYFAVFLAATVSAGMFMVVTGGTYALTNNDLIVPTVLSTLGFGLLLVTVADAVYLELGEGVYHYDSQAPLFWTTVLLGFLLQMGTIIFGVFSALLGSKYKWHFTSTRWPTARRVEHSHKGGFSWCCWPE